MALNPPAGLLHDIGIHGVAHIDLRLLAERPRVELVVAHIPHIAERGSLHDLEDHDHPLGDPGVLGVHVDKLPRAVEGSHILLDRLRVEDLAGPGDELGKPRNLDRLIALDPDLDDHVGLAGRSRDLPRVDRRQRANPGRIIGRRRRQKRKDYPENKPWGTERANDGGGYWQGNDAGGQELRPGTNSRPPMPLTRRKVSTIFWFRRSGLRLLAQILILDWSTETAVVLG